MKWFLFALIALANSTAQIAAYTQISPVLDPRIPLLDCFITNEVGSFVQFNVYNGTWLAVHPSNESLMVAQGSENRFFYSHDEGKTWHSSSLPKTISENSHVIYSKHGKKFGTIHAIGHSNDKIVATKSTDGAVSWSKPILIAQSRAAKIISAGHIGLDSSHQDNVYISMNAQDATVVSPNHWISFTRSTDNGDSFEPTRTIYSPVDDPNVSSFFIKSANFPCQAFISDGKIDYLIIAFNRELQQTSTSVNFSDHALIRSTDQGQSFETTALQIAPYIVTATTNPVSGRVVRHNFNQPRLDVDQERKIVYAVWDAGDKNSTNTAVFLSLSRDFGESWTEPVVVSRTAFFAQSSSANQAYNGAIAVTRCGMVGVIYYDYRNFEPGSSFAATDCWLDLYVPVDDPNGGSTGIGLDFVREARLTPDSFDLNPVDDPSFSPLLNLGGLHAPNVTVTKKSNDFYIGFNQTMPVSNGLIFNPVTHPLAIVDFNQRVNSYFEKVKNSECPEDTSSISSFSSGSSDSVFQ